MDIALEKVDAIRERTGLSYEEAVDYLKAAGGDVVQALVLIERDAREEGGDGKALRAEVMNKLKGLIRAGNEIRIKVKQQDDTLVELPVTVGVIGSLLAPRLALLGAIAALATRCSITVERNGEALATAEGSGRVVGEP